MPAPLNPSMLHDIPHLQDLTPDQLATINGLLHQQPLPAGYTLMTAEQPGNVAYIILISAPRTAVTAATQWRNK